MVLPRRVGAVPGQRLLEAGRRVEVHAHAVVVGLAVVAGDLEEVVVVADAERAVEGVVAEAVFLGELGDERGGVLEPPEGVVAAVVPIDGDLRDGRLARGRRVGAGARVDAGAHAVDVEADVLPRVVVELPVLGERSEACRLNREVDGRQHLVAGLGRPVGIGGHARAEAPAIPRAGPKADAALRRDDRRGRSEQRLVVDLALRGHDSGRKGQRHQDQATRPAHLSMVARNPKK